MAKTKKSSHTQSEINHVLFGDMFPQITKPKNRMRAISILHGAIENYWKKGIENTTYEDIAVRANISRPLIFKYFTDYEDIFFHAVKYIRVHFQVKAVEAMEKVNTPAEKFVAYINSTFEWVYEYPSYSSGLLLYLQKCSWDERHRELNTHFAEAGKARIAALLSYGISVGDFEVQDHSQTAKQIQTIIAGALITAACENLSNKRKYQEEIVELCCALVKIKKKKKPSAK